MRSHSEWKRVRGIEQVANQRSKENALFVLRIIGEVSALFG